MPDLFIPPKGKRELAPFVVRFIDTGVVTRDGQQNPRVHPQQRIDQLDRSRPFRPWFLRIVVNQALNFRRARGIRATGPLPDAAAANGPLPDRDAENSDLRTRLEGRMAIHSARGGYAPSGMYGEADQRTEIRTSRRANCTAFWMRLPSK